MMAPRREHVLELENLQLRARIRELETRLARSAVPCPLCGIKVTK